MPPILLIDSDKYAREIAKATTKELLRRLTPMLRQLTQGQDIIMTISEDILTEATSISDQASTLLGEVGETNTAIDEAIALIESLDVDPAQQEQLNAALTALQGAGQKLTSSATDLDTATTRLAEATADEPPADPQP